MTANNNQTVSLLVDELFGPPRVAEAILDEDLAAAITPVATQLGLWKAADRWAKRWTVPSRSAPERRHTVACTASGEWGCSCGAWIYRRIRCPHIEAVAAQLRV